MASLRLPALGRLSLDGTIFIAAFIFVGFALTGNIEPFRPGFWCDDSSILQKHPLAETVTVGALLASTLLIPLFVIFLLEAVNLSGSAKTLGVATRLKTSVRCSGKIYSTYLFGHMFLSLVVEVSKLAMGEPRPHFMDTCKPDFAKIDCSTGYVTNFTCTSSYSTAVVSDASKSFPSGHAALAFYVAMFLVVYTQLQKEPWPSRFARFGVQFGLVGLAIYCSVTRITDRRHHWWDALGGAVMGIVAGLFMGFSQWFSSDCNKRQKLSSVRHLVMAAVSEETQSRTTSQVIINNV